MQLTLISIHAPLRERLAYTFRKVNTFFKFQSTLPCGSDAQPFMWGMPMEIISIHAPLRERPLQAFCYPANHQFQSTLPCGSDLLRKMVLLATLTFQSTLPCGSDLYGKCHYVGGKIISIHAPLRERLCHNRNAPRSKLFQSTLPCGSDCRRFLERSDSEYFNPRSLAGATSATFIID